MGCVQSYFKRAHTTGISPSSTQDSNSKTGPNEDEVKPIIAEEKSLTEEPESNDTSYGVEATAVRTLAASTGTVAILGTTAKTNGKLEEEEGKQVDTIHEENENPEENNAISLEKAEVHKPNEIEQNIIIESRTPETLTNSEVNDIKADESEVYSPTQLPLSENNSVINNELLDTEEDKKEVNSEESRENSTLSRASDNSQKESSITKVEISESPTNVFEIEEKINDTNELIKEEDNSKSISSERLKTNSISDTTLSESYNAELEVNSVKQSPSVEKVLESFDSSSTVEFVDVNKEASRSKRSIDEDLIDGSVSSTPLRSTSVDIINITKENVTTPVDLPLEKTDLSSPTDNQKNTTNVINNNTEHLSCKNTDSLVFSEEETGNKTLQAVGNVLSELENNLDKVHDVIASPVNSSLNIAESQTVTSNNLISETVVGNENIEKPVENDPANPAVPKEVNHLNSDNGINISNTDGLDVDEKLISAATTIQATFRGYQTRQNLKTEDLEEKPLNQEVNDQLNSAATTIQATFRGYQERKGLESIAQNKSENSADTEIANDKESKNESDVTVATKQTEEIDKEKLLYPTEFELKSEEVSNELNSAATTIQATFRGFQTRQNLKNSETEQADSKELPNDKLNINNDLNNAEETVEATFSGLETKEDLKNEDLELKNEDLKLKNEDLKLKNEDLEKNNIVVEAVKVEDFDKLNSAATTIQSTFRGFQARRNVQNIDIVANDDEEELLAKEIQEPQFSNSNENVKEEEEINKEDKSNDECNEQLVSAATTIQATFRGFQTRQNLKNAQPENNTVVEETDNNELNEELNSAATKIQATFRGFQTRKNIKGSNDDLASELEEQEVKNTNEDSNELSSAATTIQAAFRGFQTRQELKQNQIGDQEVEETLATLDEVIKAESEDYINSEDQELSKPDEILIENEDELNNKLNSAASTIQATFRGFQTRQNLKKTDTNENEENVTHNHEALDRKTPTSLTPEIIDSVKEEVDEICKKAIATTESILAAGKKDSVSKDVEVNENEHVLPVVTSPVAISDDLNSLQNKSTEPVEDSSTGNTDYLSEDDKLAAAATTIQATFRGFQTRQNLQKTIDTEEQPDSMPDYPPPALDDESLFGPSIADEDLPPPDFEALESSYSEDVPTEPLAPPSLDHDSLKFNEEDEFDEELQSLQKPQECDELPEHRLTLNSDASTEVESSLSSAATKIQAGVRGFLTRRQYQKGTDSTSAPSIVDSDRSVGDFSISHEEEGPVRSAISIEEESEICKHRNSPDKEDIFENKILDLKKRQGKRMSLGNSLHEVPQKQRKQRALSMQIHRDDLKDEEVWFTLKNEMSSAATLIQSNYRGYRARKQLQREDAVQVQTSSSSQATPAAGSIDLKEVEPHPTRSSGEYHDIIALTPPNIQKEKPPEES